MVRAKFKVIQKVKQGEYMEEVFMEPVYSEDPNHENKAFWDATPAGQLSLSISNLPAADFFKVGQEYYLDFSKA